jgi:integrase
LAESSIRTAYTVLRAVLDTAVRDKAIAQNQAQAVRRPKVTGKEAAYLTPDQVRSLLVAAEGSRYAPLFVCSSTAACEEAKRWPSTGPTSISTPSCCGYVAPWPGWMVTSS